jgi:TonB family protein
MPLSAIKKVVKPVQPLVKQAESAPERRIFEPSEGPEDERASSSSGQSGVAAGVVGAPPPPPLPTENRARLLADAVARIRSARRYPELARRREIEGRVRVAFTVAPDGRVERISVKRSADPLLDEAACDAVRRAAPLPPIGNAEIEIDFHLAD